MESSNKNIVFLLIGLLIFLLTLKGTNALIVYLRFPATCDPSFSGETPKKCFLRKYKFSEAEYEQLTEREKALKKLTFVPRIGKLRSHNKIYAPSAQKITYHGLDGISNKSVDFDFKLSLDENSFLSLESAVTQEVEHSSNKKYNYTFYYEVDNSPDFNSVLKYRYPNLRPVISSLKGRQKDITNYDGLKLNVNSSTIRRISIDKDLSSKVTIPFNHEIFKIVAPTDRNKIDNNLIYEISKILSQEHSQIDTAHQIFSFIKMNLLWGTDSHSRAPLDIFLSKVVECGHMNSLVGVMYEMTGGRFRYVSGHDPHIRPTKPNAGHALIEIHSDQESKWSIADTFLDIFSINIATEDILKSNIKDIPILTVDDGKDGVLSFGELFRFRSYGDVFGRLPSASMAYFPEENTYGLDWNLLKFDSGKNLNTRNDKIYVRARVIATKCPIRYVNDLDSGCYGGVASYSDWKVKTIQLLQ